MTAEEKARLKIDAMLVASGWTVQTKDQINLSASLGVAICELTFATGEPDYTLFVDGKAIGTVEAKPVGVSGAAAGPHQMDKGGGFHRNWIRQANSKARVKEIKKAKNNADEGGGSNVSHHLALHLLL